MRKKVENEMVNSHGSLDEVSYEEVWVDRFCARVYRFSQRVIHLYEKLSSRWKKYRTTALNRAIKQQEK